MEKKRPGSSSGKPSASKSSSFSKPSSSRPSKPSSSSPSKSSGFFSKPAHRPEPKAVHSSEHRTNEDLKERIREKKASAFEKPEHDPGFKNRPIQSGTGYVPGTTDQVTETGETSRGRGCCGSISGLMSLIAILAAIVIVVFLVKCL